MCIFSRPRATNFIRAWVLYYLFYMYSGLRWFFYYMRHHVYFRRLQHQYIWNVFSPRRLALFCSTAFDYWVMLCYFWCFFRHRGIPWVTHASSYRKRWCFTMIFFTNVTIFVSVQLCILYFVTSPLVILIHRVILEAAVDVYACAATIYFKRVSRATRVAW